MSRMIASGAIEARPGDDDPGAIVAHAQAVAQEPQALARDGHRVPGTGAPAPAQEAAGRCAAGGGAGLRLSPTVGLLDALIPDLQHLRRQRVGVVAELRVDLLELVVGDRLDDLGVAALAVRIRLRHPGRIGLLVAPEEEVGAGGLAVVGRRRLAAGAAAEEQEGQDGAEQGHPAAGAAGRGGRGGGEHRRGHATGRGRCVLESGGRRPTRYICWMDPGPLRDALTILTGVATGTMSGLFGVGGAVISTPAIRALGASAAVAVGTTLPSIIPGAASGTARYMREGLIDGRVVRWTAPAGIVAAVLGSWLSKIVPGEGHLLMLMTAALLGFSAWRMYATRSREPAVAAESRRRGVGPPPSGPRRRALGAGARDHRRGRRSPVGPARGGRRDRHGPGLHAVRQDPPEAGDRDVPRLRGDLRRAGHDHPRDPGRHRLALRAAAGRRRDPGGPARRRPHRPRRLRPPAHHRRRSSSASPPSSTPPASSSHCF